MTYSLGRPWIDNRVGGLVNGIEPEFIAMNDNGAFLLANFIYVDSYAQRGEIISQSHYNQWVALDTTVTFRISRGNLQPPAGFDPPMGEFPPDDD